MSVIVKSVIKGSAAARSGAKSGDVLLSLNGNEIMDVLDYRFYQNESKISVCYVNSKGKQKTKKVKKPENEELGFEFDTYLMDKQRACKNKCVFCFIDQLPKGMRDSLYFKDDDSRLSFLFGNYITLTNITEHEIERIIKMHISPVNISVHTTNPELRVRMMRNPTAARITEIMQRFDDAGIAMNCQLVLCPDYNDGEELRRTLTDLTALKNVRSIAAVPVGLTRYRDGLAPLEKFTSVRAGEVIDIIESFRDRARVYPSDEFFLLAGREIPEAEYYGDFYQLENGVGMWALMRMEAADALELVAPPEKEVNISAVTGVSAYPLISDIVDRAQKKWHNLKCNVYMVKNDFFGHNITVAGLITGGDIINQLKGKPLGDRLLIPDNMLRHENDMFLDDVTVEQLARELSVTVDIVPSGGYEFVSKLKGD